MVEDDEHGGFFNKPIQGVITGDSGKNVITEFVSGYPYPYLLS